MIEKCPRCQSILINKTYYKCSNKDCFFRWNLDDFNCLQTKLELSNMILSIKELEIISHKIRKGIPVDFSEAIYAIEYQKELKKIKFSVLDKIKIWFSNL